MAFPSISFVFLCFFCFSFLNEPRLSLADHVLYTDEILMPGQNLTNGPYLLAMHHNCRLVLYNNTQPSWSTNATANGNSDCYLVLTQRGELVVRRSVHYALWSSGARSKKGKYALVLDAKGRIAIYGHRRWSTSNPNGLGGPEDLAIEEPATEYVLQSGHRMLAGDKLKYKEYELAFWRCNLVINHTRSGRWLWQTNTKVTQGPAGCYLQLESSGELSVKNGAQRLWSSNKRTDSGLHLAVLRFDGRLAVYGPLVWSNVRMDDSIVADAVTYGGSEYI
ncbi:mannose-specific lectin 2-like [Dendrobium catenatum]|uniref:Mannose-specific lectin n=1 Tax=Dendrobium catenatum TaxID=906689 RepID=A0A2I0WN67_9ASPA|nr:mannose-specific lectin 2-like [Dendrobium catenatum]PKU77105.1 Mannose-specific lectin [Dendrobium catenatum]